VKNSYLTPRPPHPLTLGLEDAPRVIGPSEQIQVRAHDGGVQPLTLVPSYPDLPMERVYTLQEKTEIPAVFCRAFGKGRVVYFPSNIDTAFWDLLAADHLALLANAVRWACDETPVLTVKGAGLVDVAYWRQDRSLTAHLVNLTNPMALKGPLREIIPAGPFEVGMRLPSGAVAKSVHLLEAGGTVPYRMEGDTLTLTVPRIALHEVVAVDL
jgi:hypothetical protein